MPVHLSLPEWLLQGKYYKKNTPQEELTNGRDGGREGMAVKKEEEDGRKEEKRSALESLVSRIRVDAGGLN